MPFQKENAKESFKVCVAYSAIKFVVKMHFKDAKEAAHKKVTLFFQVLFTKVEHTSRAFVSTYICDMTSLDKKTNRLA